MIEWLGLVGSLMVGLGLGVVFFGGLWLTLGRLPSARQPALLMLGSLLGRMALVLLGFYAVLRLDETGGLQRVLACLVGLILARQFLLRRWRVDEVKS